MEQSALVNPDFLLFGATGMQGRIVTRDLVERGYKVAVSGSTLSAVQDVVNKYNVLGFQLDLSNSTALNSLAIQLRPKVIINCAEGDWNVAVYKAALQAGAHVIDLGSDIPVTKEQFALHKDFEQAGLTAITGCGSTPGVNNVMLDYAVQFLDEVETIEAGFAWNSNIKKFVVPFSMESILEEFIDPASIVENGAWVQKAPIDSVIEKDFRFVGPQKLFYVRHPEPYTFYENYKNKGVKNVRYYAGFPPHSFEVIMSLVPGTKLRPEKTVDIPGKGTIPLHDLTRTMKEMYPAPAGYVEQENLWVTVTGKKAGVEKQILMECLVPTVQGWEEAGCNIDTAFPASIMAQMLLNGEITKRGSFAPESVVPHVPFFKALKERSMSVWMDGQRVPLV